MTFHKLNAKKVAVCSLCLVALLVFLNLVFFSPPKNFPTETIVFIKEGISLRSISRGLKVNNIIRSRVVFETYAIMLGSEKRLKYGGYFFENKLSVFEVARRLAEGERHLVPVRVTIPEGFSSLDISEVFVSQLINFRKSRFLSEAASKEGRLFPDTYLFLPTDSEQDVLRSMTENFERRVAPLRPRIASSGKTEKEIITMASLIEEESKGDVDRALISGILWKRLSIRMPLQVDAEPSTYRKRGLPESPISNPGLSSIEASLSPKDSPYLYYLHDGEGNAHFAKTFAEHVSNKKRYLR